MKISLKTEGKKFFILLPNWLFLNSFALKIAKRAPGGVGVPDIPPKAIRKLRKTLRQMRRIHKKWSLVDVVDHEGTTVNIKL